MTQRGRPPIPVDERKMFNVTMRMRKDLRAKILAAAKANGRSMATECEARLEQSFVFEDVTAWLNARDL